MISTAGRPAQSHRGDRLDPPLDPERSGVPDDLLAAGDVEQNGFIYPDLQQGQQTHET